MSHQSLWDAHEKLRWAKAHYEPLRREVDAFEKTHDYTVRVEPDADTGEYVFYVDNLRGLSPDWGLRIGDCIHACRSALDHLLVRLVCVYTQQDPSDVGDVDFPVYSDATKFGKSGRPRLADKVLPGHLTRIEELQPFHAHDPSIWGQDLLLPRPSLAETLQTVSHLDNVDKHRVIHPTWHRSDWEGGLPELPAGHIMRSAGHTAAHQSLDNGAELLRVTIEPPLVGWQPDPVDMKGHFPLSVGLPPYKWVWYPVTETLRRAIRAVDAVLFIFEPVFTHHEPPLPVTEAARLFLQ